LTRPNSATGERGFLLITVVVAVAVLSVMMMVSLPVIETQLQRDLEEELLFRGRQYVRAIELYLQKHPNLYPRNLEILFLEKCLRRPYKDPMTTEEKWDLVYQTSGAGKQSLIIVPSQFAGEFANRGFLVGVCSSSPEASFREYRGKKKYNEWAFFVGAKEETEMPEIQVYTGK